jgi:hypothetical protein
LLDFTSQPTQNTTTASTFDNTVTITQKRETERERDREEEAREESLEPLHRAGEREGLHVGEADRVQHHRVAGGGLEQQAVATAREDLRGKERSCQRACMRQTER